MATVTTQFAHLIRFQDTASRNFKANTVEVPLGKDWIAVTGSSGIR